MVTWREWLWREAELEWAHGVVAFARFDYAAGGDHNLRSGEYFAAWAEAAP